MNITASDFTTDLTAGDRVRIKGDTNSQRIGTVEHTFRANWSNHYPDGTMFSRVFFTNARKQKLPGAESEHKVVLLARYFVKVEQR